jgi:sporulation protein YlmC with PRC-barrel domain
MLACAATAAQAQTTTTPPAHPPGAATSAPAPKDNTVSTGDFNVHGDMSANALIGASVHNANRDTVGTVKDMYVDAGGNIKSVVLSVGGFLGVGSKDVAVGWKDMKYSRDGKSVRLTTDLSKDALKAMPSYDEQRRQPASEEQATAPSKSHK